LFVGRPISVKGKQIIKETERLCHFDGIKADFTYIENVPYHTLHAYYQNADILVVPSLYSEGFPRVVSEAASCGCIIAASDRGALPELVKPFGFVIEPTAKQFRNVICSLANDKQMTEALRRKTIMYAKEKFSSKNGEVFL